MAFEPLTVDRYRGALVGLALGDALGAPYEFKSPPFTMEAVFRQGVFGTAPGHPTDDSTLALFAAEAVLESDDWPAGYTRRLVAWMQSGPPDIGNQTSVAAHRWAAGAAPEPDEAAQGGRIQAAGGTRPQTVPCLWRATRSPKNRRYSLEKP